MTDNDILEALTPDATNILLDKPYRSFCGGSDQLVALGVWTDDGGLTEQGERVKKRLKMYE